MQEKAKAEELKRNDPEVAREVAKAAPEEPPPSDPRVKRPFATLGVYALLFVGFTVIYYLLHWQAIPIINTYLPLAERATVGGLSVIFVLILYTLIKVYLISRIEEAAARYNLGRIAKLIAGLAIFLITISV